MTEQSSYLAIDPGETIGWATFRDNGTVLAIGQTRFETFVKDFQELIHPDLKQVITEEYKNYGHKQQRKWSKNNTSKVIGKIEVLCELAGVGLTMQPANNYRIGAMWGGFEIPTDHSISHQYVAAAHGIYYLQSIGVRPIGLGLKK